MKLIRQMFCCAALLLVGIVHAQEAKHRVLVLTDIENEPDDTQSMIRFLTYSNQWDIEGLVATTSIHQQKRVAPEKIKQLIEAYRTVRPNLLLHEKGYPEADYLISITKSKIFHSFKKSSESY